MAISLHADMEIPDGGIAGDRYYELEEDLETWITISVRNGFRILQSARRLAIRSFQAIFDRKIKTIVFF